MTGLYGSSLLGALLLAGDLGGEVVLGVVLVDGVARYAVHLGDIRDAEPVAALLAYRIAGGHVDHCLSCLSE